MNDLFYEGKNSNIASYVDDTILYSCATDIPSVVLELQASASKRFHWLRNNHLKVHPEKSQILLSTKESEIVSTGGIPLAASCYEKLLGVTIDSELKFQNRTLQSYVSKLAKNLILSAIPQVPCFSLYGCLIQGY